MRSIISIFLLLMFFNLNTKATPVQWPIKDNIYAITIGDQVMNASDVEDGAFYVLYHPRSRGCVLNNDGALMNADGQLGTTALNGSTNTNYVFRLISNGNGTYKIQAATGLYFPVINADGALRTSEEAGSYSLNFTVNGNIFPECNNFRLDRAWGAVYGFATKNDNEGSSNAQCYQLHKVSELTFQIPEMVTAYQCYETTGRSNNDAVLRIDLHPIDGVKLTSLTATLTGREYIDSVSLYATTGTNFYGEEPRLIASAETAETVILKPNYNLSVGINHLWLTLRVKPDAELSAVLDAAVTAIEYTYNDEATQLEVTDNGNPEGDMKVYDVQSYVFVPNTYNCRYYRIPAMIVDRDGNIVAAVDKRYDSKDDLGNHKIDVVSMRSEDGGRTWKDRANIAIGDGSTEAGFGYGDAALSLAPNGNLVCIMAAGSKGNGYGMIHAGISVSSDCGRSWSEVRSLFASNFTDAVSGKQNAHGFTDIFTSSGKGLTTCEGVIMYATVARPEGGNTTNCYILKSDDNGQSWTVGPEVAYTGSDEAKLEQMNDGSLLLTMRQNGNRGWNKAKADATGWGTQYRTSDISGTACNADILYYSRSISKEEPDILLHTYINDTQRRNLCLAMSIDGGNTWNTVYNIVKGSSGYSTMACLADGSVAILFEDETYTDGNGYTINYVTLSQQQILEWYNKLNANKPDGIIVFKSDSTTSATGAYNLAGQRVEAPTKGIYIVDGKKVIVK